MSESVSTLRTVGEHIELDVGDGTEVSLTIPDLAPVMQMKIHFDLETADGEEMIGDLHNTIHALADPFE